VNWPWSWGFLCARTIVFALAIVNHQISGLSDPESIHSFGISRTWTCSKTCEPLSFSSVELERVKSDVDQLERPEPDCRTD
jgi:hypothetical protein